MKKENQNLKLKRYPKGYSVKGEIELPTGTGQLEVYTTSKNKQDAISRYEREVESYGYKLEQELNDIEELTTLIRANRKGSK